MPLKPGETAPAPEPNNPGGGEFNAEEFSKQMVGEFDKRTNATDKKLNALMKLVEGLAAPKPADPPNPNPNPDPTNTDNPNPDIKEAKTIADLNSIAQRQEKRIEALMAENEASKKAASDAEAKRLEAERVSAFDGALADLDIPNPKARQQFRDAYLGKVKRDDDGAFVVDTEAGPMSYKEFLRAEYDLSPHFQAPLGTGGAGATGGKKPSGAPRMDVASMPMAEIQKMTTQERGQYLQDLIRQAQLS